MGQLGFSAKLAPFERRIQGHTAFASYDLRAASRQRQARSLQLFFCCLPQKSGLIQHRFAGAALAYWGSEKQRHAAPCWAAECQRDSGSAICLAAQRFPLRWELRTRATPLQFEETDGPVLASWSQK